MEFAGFCEFRGILWTYLNFTGVDDAKISETLTRGILSFCTKGIKIKNVGP